MYLKRLGLEQLVDVNNRSIFLFSFFGSLFFFWWCGLFFILFWQPILPFFLFLFSFFKILPLFFFREGKKTKNHGTPLCFF